MRYSERLWHHAMSEVMQDLDPKEGEYILDLGCGDGELSFVIQFDATVLGIDIDANRVEDARRRGVEARVEDAQNIQFDCEFDAVFSNKALHYMPRQQDVVMRVFNALKPGGRFVAAMGGVGNVISVRQAVAEILEERNINFFERESCVYPTPDEQRERLENAGFNVTKCELRTRSSTMSSTDIREWFNVCWHFDKILFDLSVSDRNEIVSSMVERLNSNLCDTDGKWTVEGVLLHFVALKPNDH